MIAPKFGADEKPSMSNELALLSKAGSTRAQRLTRFIGARGARENAARSGKQAATA